MLRYFYLVLMFISPQYIFGGNGDFDTLSIRPIGVDYSSNLLQSLTKKWKQNNKISEALITTGPFIIVASLTTIIGYTSLLFTKQQSLFSFGKLALIGELLTLFAALILLPTLFSFLFKIKIKKS